MSQENVEIVRRVAEVWNESGWVGAAAQGLVHPEVEYHDDQKWPEARSAFGSSALAKRFEEITEILGEESKVEMEELFDAGGDQVVAIFRFIGEARVSGIHHDHRWGYLYRVRNGQIFYIQAFIDPADALEAAGLEE